MNWRFPGLAIVLLLGGCDVVREQHDTLADARGEGIFERGWLPDVLPASATDIRSANNLDINTSVASFDYIVGDDVAMLATMHVGAPADAPFDDWSYIVAKRRSGGMPPWTWRGNGSTWVFFCNRAAGRCEKWQWPRS
jgi:hypothetical protein